MTTTIQIKTRKYTIDLSQPLDISIPIRASKNNVHAWYIGKPKIEPVELDGWIGSVKQGGDVNFNNIYFNPHSHGTHTECVGHITEKVHSINDCLKQFMFMAEVITVAPEKIENDDYIISKKQLQYALKKRKPEALIVRTIPNLDDKLSKQHSNTNWAYFTEDAILFLLQIGVKHLLVDLPSIDKEKDDGVLIAHKTFWNVNGAIRFDATITEMIYVRNTIEDGKYILNLQIAAFENDASPSKPVLYKIK